jgi:FkbM family methyltransferase
MARPQRETARQAWQHLRNALDPGTRSRPDDGSDADLLRLEAGLALLLRRMDQSAVEDVDLRRLVSSHLQDQEFDATVAWLPPSVIDAETDMGHMLLPGQDRFITPSLVAKGTWEPPESAFIDATVHRGMTAVDIGAHVGYHALRLARAVGSSGRVIAFEPSPQNYALLCANIERNRLTNVLPLHAAAGRTSGPVELTLSADNTGGNRAYRLDYVEPNLRVTGVAVDDILPERALVDFVKVDIEGMDHVAIEGMAKTILRHPPIVLAEFNPQTISQLGDEPEKVLEMYREFGYDLVVLGAFDSVAQEPAVIVEQARRLPHGYVTLVLQPRRVASDVETPDAKSVTRCYVELLGRAPAASELRAQCEALDRRSTITDVARQLIRSNEYREKALGSVPADPHATDEEYIGQAYAALLGRPPDPGGRENFLTFLREGNPRGDLLKIMVASEEHISRAISAATDAR